MTDDVWLNVETREQRERWLWTKNLTVGRLGFVKQADINIVMSRKNGGRLCGNAWSWRYIQNWIKNNSEIVSNAYRHRTLALVTSTRI